MAERAVAAAAASSATGKLYVELRNLEICKPGRYSISKSVGIIIMRLHNAIKQQSTDPITWDK